MTALRRRIPNRQLGVWHRRLGLAVAAILTWVVLSGLLLNHSSRLGLDRLHVRSAWLLDRYGFQPRAEPRGVMLAGHWLSELGERVYFDARELPNVRGRLRGAVLFGDGMAAAVGDDVWVLTPTGDVIERLGEAHGVPSAISALGLDREGWLVAQAALGFYATDGDLLEWRRITPRAVSWGRPAAVPTSLQLELVGQYRGRALTVERLLVDLHGGRIMGELGVWVVDAAALSCLGLAITGVWLWARRRQGE